PPASLPTQFSPPPAPRRPLHTTRVHLYARPDTTPVAGRALFPSAQYDPLQAKARAAADSARRAVDTPHARRDTTRAGPPPPGPPAPPAPPPPACRPAAPLPIAPLHPRAAPPPPTQPPPPPPVLRRRRPAHSP